MAYRLLESLSKRQLENITGNRLLEGSGTIGLSVYPDAYQATGIQKTQSFLQATAIIKTYNPYMATAIIKTYNPYLAASQLKGILP